MSHDVVKVKREALVSRMTCPLCRKLFCAATTIVECLHTFCRKCIYKKLSDEEMESCPVCNINLGCAPLNKLRPDHSLQNIRDQTFPSKIIKVKDVEMVTPITLPAKIKETTLSAPAVGTSRVLNQIKKNTSDDHKFDKGNEKINQTLEGKVGKRKLLNCLAAAANNREPPKFSTQVSIAKFEATNSCDNEGLTNKEKSMDKWQSSIICNEMRSTEDICSEPEFHKKLERGRDQAMSFGEPTIPPHVVPNAYNAQIGPTNRPIWFSLVASDIKEGNNSPLPQISANYIRIKDGRMPVSVIQEYLKSKLNLTSEDEVEIKCMDQRVCPTSTLDNLMEMCIQSSSAERVSTTIGSLARNFVMVLSYARGFPDLNKALPIHLSE